MIIECHAGIILIMQIWYSYDVRTVKLLRTAHINDEGVFVFCEHKRTLEYNAGHSRDNRSLPASPTRTSFCLEQTGACWGVAACQAPAGSPQRAAPPALPGCHAHRANRMIIGLLVASPRVGFAPRNPGLICLSDIGGKKNISTRKPRLLKSRHICVHKGGARSTRGIHRKFFLSLDGG